MLFRYWTEGFKLIGMFLLFIGVPCFIISRLGIKLITKLGNHPSRSAEIQMSIFWQTVTLMFFTFLCLVGSFYVLDMFNIK